MQRLQPCVRDAMRVSAMRVSLVVAVGAAIGGCTVMVVEPARPTSSQLAQGLTFTDAVDYLERARTNMNDGLSSVDQVDTATRFGVGLGVGAAAINTLAQGRPDVTLGLLGVAGIGYSVAQTSSLPGQRDIYSAGLNSLDCIEKTGYRVHRDTSDARSQLVQRRPELDAAVAALMRDLDSIARQTPVEAAAAGIEPKARELLQAGIRLQRSATDFIHATDVGPEMFYGVSKTVRAVNTQLRARAPSLDEIARAGTILTGFVSAHTPVASNAQATTAAAAKVPFVLQAGGHPLADQIQRDVDRLRRVAEEVQTMLPPSGYASTQLLDACQAMVPGQLPFRVRPDGPIRITAGGDAYALSVESELPLVFGFHGAQPSAQQLVVSQPSDRTFSIAAPGGAKADEYLFYIAQKGGRELPDLQVTVVAATPTTTGTPGTGNQDASKSTRTSLTFAKKLKLLGLGADTKSESDAAFKDRVKKLDNCFKIEPSTGVLGDKLIAALRDSEAVKGAGDCPKPKAANNAASPASAPASAPPANNAVPIPKPPVPGASG